MSDTEHPTHLFSYRFNGARWSFDMKAKNADEARERLKALVWATYDGVVIARIPIAPRPLIRLGGRLKQAVASLLTPRGG